MPYFKNHLTSLGGQVASLKFTNPPLSQTNRSFFSTSSHTSTPRDRSPQIPAAAAANRRMPAAVAAAGAAAASGTALLAYILLACCRPQPAPEAGEEEEEESRLLSSGAEARGREAGDGGEEEEEWPYRPPSTCCEAAAVAARTARRTWDLTVGRWGLHGIAFGIKRHMKRQVREIFRISPRDSSLLCAITAMLPVFSSSVRFCVCALRFLLAN